MDWLKSSGNYKSDTKNEFSFSRFNNSWKKEFNFSRINNSWNDDTFQKLNVE